MAKKQAVRKRTGLCNPACTRILKFMTKRTVPANTGISIPPYDKIDGFRHVNIFVEYTQEKHDEPSVDLGVLFAMDAKGTLRARRYVNLEENVPAPQSTNMVSVSGDGSWHGNPHNISSYVARFPVMGPYVEVVVYNTAPVERKVTVWGYLVS
jgi:hypothetical protein